MIPVGLRGALPKTSYITFTLAIGLVCYFFYDNPAAKLENDEILASFREARFSENLETLFTQYCQGYKIEKSLCEKTAKPLFAKFSGDEHVRRKTLSNTEKPKHNPSFKSDVQQVSLLDSTIQKFMKQVNDPGDDFKQLPSYPEFLETKEKLQGRLSDLQKKHNLFSKNNLSLPALIRAQIKHSNASHLFSNLLALIFFGAYLEARMNPVLFVLCYVLGGFLGVGSYFNFQNSTLTHIVGASANISALMGAFFVCFYRFRLRFINVFPFRFFSYPVIWVFPLLYLLTSIVSMEQNSLGGGVAHSAHLIGMLIGIGFGLIEKHLDNIPWPFVSFQDLQTTLTLKNLKNIKSKAALASEITKKNPDNFFAQAAVIQTISELPQTEEPREPTSWLFLKDQLYPFCWSCVKNKQRHRSVNLLAQLPLGYDLRELLKRADRSTLINLADFATDRKQYDVAIQLYDVFVFHFPKSPNRPLIIKSIAEIVTIQDSQEGLAEFLMVFCETYPDSCVTQLVRSSKSKIERRNDEYKFG